VFWGEKYIEEKRSAAWGGDQTAKTLRIKGFITHPVKDLLPGNHRGKTWGSQRGTKKGFVGAFLNGGHTL